LKKSARPALWEVADYISPLHPSPLGKRAGVRGQTKYKEKEKLTFWGKKVTWEVTIMVQNIMKDKNLYKILGPKNIRNFLGTRWDL
jgi:hypothetical protein